MVTLVSNPRIWLQPLPTSRTTSSSRASWAGVPADERRAERRRLLLDVGFDLLGSEGLAGVTVRAVCLGARLNARYFYESFADLEALVVAVYDRVVEDLQAQVRAALQGLEDDVARTRAGVEAIVRFVDEDRRRARILYVEALADDALNRRRVATGQAIVEALLEEAASRTGTVNRRARVAAAVLVGGLSEALNSWLAGRIKATRRQLVDDLSDLLLGLGAAAGRRRR